MTQSPELGLKFPAAPIELLRAHDPDPYGYIAHTAAILEWMPVDDKNGAYGVVANYASDTHDPELMRASLGELDTPAQWKVFAYEVRSGGATLDIEAITRMSEAAVVHEMTPEADRDWLALSDIYASQLEIALCSGMKLEEPIQNLSLALGELRDRNGSTPYLGDGLRRNAVHMLLRAGLSDPAAEIAAGLHREDYRKEYQDSLPLYQREHAGKRQSAKLRTENNKSIFRELDPGLHLKIVADQREMLGEQDIMPLLQMGSVDRARRLYDKVLDSGSEQPMRRLRMALDMATSVPASSSHGEHELMVEMAGLTSMAEQITEGTGSDVNLSMSQSNMIKDKITSFCKEIDRLPFSSNRVELTLQVTHLQREVLQDSKLAAEQCDTLLLDTWRKCVRTLTLTTATDTHYEPYVRQLWGRLREVGFDVKKLRAMDPLFAECYQPKFRSRSDEPSAS